MEPEAQALFAAEAGITNTPDGILTNVDPAPRTSPAPSVTETSQPVGKYTEEDLARVRREEKSKLYEKMESLSEKLARLEKEREDRLAAEQEAVRAAEEEARKKAESEMDLRSLLEQKQREWEQQLEAERVEREKAFALLQREREYQALLEYRQNRLADEQENIIPELVDLVQGNTPEEIEASLASLKDRSARILQSAQSAMQNARRDMVGARVTAPAVGPMDTNTGQQELTPDAIAGLTMDQYVQLRPKLLGGNKPRSARGMWD